MLFCIKVCCTAIVYATDRKNTKVEFPEARIYEETLNCLLYENRTGPDQDLMQVLLKADALELTFHLRNPGNKHTRGWYLLHLR